MKHVFQFSPLCADVRLKLCTIKERNTAFRSDNKACEDVFHLLCRPFYLFITGMFSCFSPSSCCAPLMRRCWAPCRRLDLQPQRPWVTAGLLGPGPGLVAPNWLLQLFISGRSSEAAAECRGRRWRWKNAPLLRVVPWGSWSQEGEVSVAVQLSREPQRGRQAPKPSGKSRYVLFYVLFSSAEPDFSRMLGSLRRRMRVSYSQSGDQGAFVPVLW